MRFAACDSRVMLFAIIETLFIEHTDNIQVIGFVGFAETKQEHAQLTAYKTLAISMM